MAKQKCIKIYTNNTFDEKAFKIKEGAIIDGKNPIGFTPLCVFDENKPRHKFWRGAKRLIFFVDGALSALQFSEANDNMQLSWGKEEAKAFVKKMVALEAMSIKPIKLYQFIILLIVNVIGIAGIFYMLSILMRL